MSACHVTVCNGQFKANAHECTVTSDRRLARHLHNAFSMDGRRVVRADGLNGLDWLHLDKVLLTRIFGARVAQSIF